MLQQLWAMLRLFSSGSPRAYDYRGVVCRRLYHAPMRADLAKVEHRNLDSERDWVE